MYFLLLAVKRENGAIEYLMKVRDGIEVKSSFEVKWLWPKLLADFLEGIMVWKEPPEELRRELDTNIVQEVNEQVTPIQITCTLNSEILFFNFQKKDHISEVKLDYPIHLFTILFCFFSSLKMPHA